MESPVEDWPICSKTNIAEILERKAVVNCNAISEKETLTTRIDINRFSKLQRLLNTTARILMLYRRYKNVKGNAYNENAQKDNEQLVRQDGQELTVDILEAAENLWIKEAQELLVEHMDMGKLTRLCPRWLGGKIVVAKNCVTWICHFMFTYLSLGGKFVSHSYISHKKKPEVY